MDTSVLVNKINFTPYKINPDPAEDKEESGEADKSGGERKKREDEVKNYLFTQKADRMEKTVQPCDPPDDKRSDKDHLSTYIRILHLPEAEEHAHPVPQDELLPEILFQRSKRMMPECLHNQHFHIPDPDEYKV